MGRRVLLTIAAILTAALGTALIWLYVQGADTRAAQKAGLVKVLALTGAAEAGAPVERLPVGFVEVSAAVAQRTVRDLAAVRGQRLKQDAQPGQLLVPGMLTSGTVSAIPAKQGFVSLTIGEPYRVPALLKAGSDVALYVLGRDGCVRLVVPRVQVYAVGSSPAAGQQQTPATIVGFLSDPQTNLDIITAETLGTPVLELLGKDAVAAKPPACRGQ